MINHYRIHPTKLLNRRTLRMLTILAAVAAVCTAVMSALGALLMVRQLQLVALQRRTLPVLRQAAQLYLDQNAPASVPAPPQKVVPPPPPGQGGGDARPGGGAAPGASLRG